MKDESLATRKGIKVLRMVETSVNEMTLGTKPIVGESRVAGITRPETLTGPANKHEQCTHASPCKH